MDRIPTACAGLMPIERGARCDREYPMNHQRGFTLMELIITMCIIGILTAIAIPNYTAYIQRSNRSEARSALLEAAAWMERWRTQNWGIRKHACGTTVAPPMFPFAQVRLLDGKVHNSPAGDSCVGIVTRSLRQR